MEMVDETTLEEYMYNLTVEIGPRMTGTYGCEKAAEYLLNNFEESGYEARYHEWGAWGNEFHKRYFESKNVIATHKGKNEKLPMIIFNAHYDTVKLAPGAIDDGSGVVAVMLAAKILRQFEFNRTIEFVLFSGEEVGLLGSNAYSKELYHSETDLLVQINADMIGYTKEEEDGGIARLSFTKDARWMYNEIAEVNSEYGPNFNLPYWETEPYSGSGGSDYRGFLDHGYDFIAFWEAGWYSGFFHTPEDTIDKVNFSYLANMTKLIVGSIARLADINNPNPEISIASPKRDKIYYKDRMKGNFQSPHILIIDGFDVYFDVTESYSPIDRIEVYYDDKLIQTITEKPYRCRIDKFSMRYHDITATVYDTNGRNSSDQIRAFIFNRIFSKFF